MEASQQVIASEDAVVYDEALTIHRMVFAGQPVPPELVDAYNAKVGESSQASSGEAAASGDRFEQMDKPALQAEADERGLTVEGTGADGNVLVGDLRKALRAGDEATA